MSDLFSDWFVFILFGGLAIGSAVLNLSLYRRKLEGWARENALTILESQYRFFFRGPFFWRAAAVFHVKLRNASGAERRGWVCCHPWPIATEVKWDDS